MLIGMEAMGNSQWFVDLRQLVLHRHNLMVIRA